MRCCNPCQFAYADIDSAAIAFVDLLPISGFSYNIAQKFPVMLLSSTIFALAP